jgi:hypothetical protein
LRNVHHERIEKHGLSRDEKKEIKRDQSQIPLLKDALAASLCMRKILANTATYMILDDHEITDDFNITPEWTDTVRSKPLGARIVTNALIAYWFFQGWGNDPLSDNYCDITKKLGNEAFERPSSGKDNFSDLIGNPRWSYITPTNPPAVFIDSRMNREKTSYMTFVKSSYDAVFKNIEIPHYGGSKTECTQMLVSKSSFDVLVHSLTELNKEFETVVVCTPSPVFGIEFFDAVFELAATNDRDSFMKREQELWTYNPYGKKNFVDFLIKLTLPKQQSGIGLKNVSLLAGDVHFSYAKKIEVLKNEALNLTIHQFTASAIKNPTTIVSSLDPLVTKKHSHFWTDITGLGIDVVGGLKDAKLAISRSAIVSKESNFRLDSQLLTIPKIVGNQYAKVPHMKVPWLKETSWGIGTFGYLSSKLQGFYLAD